MSSGTPGPRLRFADFEVNVEIGEVRRYDHRIKLQEKPFQILLALLERPGGLVSREELQQRLWPANTFVDFDHNLNNAVDKLRKALNDSAEEPKFIKTVPRRGYRFIATVERFPLSVVTQHSEVTRPAETPAAEVPVSSATAPDEISTRLAEINLYRKVSHAPSSPKWTRLAVSAILVLALLLVLFRFSGLTRLFASPAAIGARRISSFVIQNDGGIDPIDGGFRLRSLGHYESEAMRNQSNSGFDRLRVVSDDQMYYYRPLTTAEKAAAASHDWRLTCVCAIEAGGAWAVVDFGSEGHRYDIELLQEDNKFFVALTQQISPKFELVAKTEFPGVADVAHPHTFELRYSHAIQAATLWIDGHMVYSGYRGHTQWVQDRGLMFGTGSYLSSRTGIAVFRSVRFEVQ